MILEQRWDYWTYPITVIHIKRHTASGKGRTKPFGLDTVDEPGNA